MRKPAKTAAVLFGLGVGVAAGPSLGTAAVWTASTANRRRLAGTPRGAATEAGR